MEDIIGHQRIQKYFATLLERERLHHAYCFIGPAHVGKETLARWVAGQLLERSKNDIETHPDFFLLAPQYDEKKEKMRHGIEIDQVRRLISAFSLRQSRGGYRVALIKPAEALTVSASNALLKLLEEPGEKTVILLSAEDDEQLLPTIRSRSHLIHFGPVSFSEVRQHLITTGLPSEEAERRSRLCRGLPGLARQWLTQPELLEEYDKEVEAFVSLLGQPIYQKMIVADILLGNEKDHGTARVNLARLFDLWQVIARDYLHQLNGKDDYMIHHNIPAKEWPQEKACRFVDALQLAKERLAHNINPRLLIEQVILTLP